MALDTDLIISVEDFRDYTGISDSFDANWLAPIIERATDLNAQQVLGTALMEKLITDYNADTLAGVYLEMYNSSKCSVKKMVIWQSYVHGLPRFAYKIQNSGISKTGGNLESESITPSELASMTREAEATMVLYENRVKTYLMNNYSSISELAVTTPEFLKSNTSESTTSQGLGTTPNLKYNDI